jgi:hypothetical protein
MGISLHLWAELGGLAAQVAGIRRDIFTTL